MRAEPGQGPGGPCAPIPGTIQPRAGGGGPLSSGDSASSSPPGTRRGLRGSREGTRTESGEGHVARQISQEKLGLPAPPGPAVSTSPVPDLLSRPFSTNPPFTPSFSPHPVTPFPFPSRHPPSWPFPPLLPKSRTPFPLRGSSPLSLKSLALPRGPAYPRRPPRPPGPGPGRGGRCGTARAPPPPHENVTMPGPRSS